MAGRSEERRKTTLMIAVNESNVKGYPHPSISSKGAFEWTLDRIIGTNTSGFKILILHVQVPDEDGMPNLRATSPKPFARPSQTKNYDKYFSPEGMHNLRATSPMPFSSPSQLIISDLPITPEGMPNLRATSPKPFARPSQTKNYDKYFSPEGMPNHRATSPMPFSRRSQPKISDLPIAPEGIPNLRANSPMSSSVRLSQLDISAKPFSPKGRSSFDDIDSVYASPDDFKNLKRQDKKKGSHLLEYFVNRCHELGIEREAWIKRGDPKEEILREVKRVRPDLLVVGSRGLGPFQKVFVGTVSEFCAKHADCPVITIKRSAEESPNDLADD